MEAVRNNDLVKVYKRKDNIQALGGVNLTVSKGELFALLGQKEAGKTTFLRMISTKLLPTTGEAIALGFDVKTQEGEICQRISVVPHYSAVYSNLTPWEYYYYFSLLRGWSKPRARYKCQNVMKYG